VPISVDLLTAAERHPGVTSRRLEDIVHLCSEVLQRAGVPRPAKESRDLAAAILDKPRFWATLHPDQQLAAHEVHALLFAATRRASGAPFAYAVGRATFRFLTLHVDERVLIPRPETEMLVELVLASDQAKRSAGGVAADVGTGSGAIALALAAEGKFERVIGADVSRDALDVAQHNARLTSSALRAPVEFRQGDALVPLRGERVDIVVSNPPYIAFQEVNALPDDVRNWEPPAALACANDGLAVTQAIAHGAASVLAPRGLLALEIDCRRAERVVELLRGTDAFEAITVRRDLTGRDRFVTATRRE
jgi:release factor glutamine methyltransferase